MGSFEIVFYQPPGQFLIEFGDFNGEISQVDEFFLNSPVKSLIDGIVFGSSISAPVMSDIEFSAGLVEETVEFRRKDISDEEESPEPTKSFLKNTSRRKMFWNSGRQL